MRRSLLSLALALGSVAVACDPAHAADSAGAANTVSYPDLIAVSNYPAHVQAIHFDNGTMDAANTYSWGAWTVSFGAQLPVATYLSNGIAQVQVNGLVCTNAIAGSNSCGMNISPNGCAQGLGPNTPPILISCPELIDLTP
jgi:hypothetical protein